MTTTPATPGTQKVRRDLLGGKRADGRALQFQRERVSRPDPSRLRLGTPEDQLTGVAGLLAFGQFLRELKVDGELVTHFDRLKADPFVVYPMHTQLRVLLDLFALGDVRVFALEARAADPLFVYLAGGEVASIDTFYKDLRRVDATALQQLEALMSHHGLASLRSYARSEAHLDFDTTVCVRFGQQEGAEPGPNPRYHGRPSFHPLLAYVAETNTCVGAKLRPGSTAFGNADVRTTHAILARVRAALGRGPTLWVRMDSAGDCTDFLVDVASFANTYVLVKAEITPELLGAIQAHEDWRTVDVDANDVPQVQVATIDFQRDVWAKRGVRFRVVAVRSRIRETGKHIAAWADEDWTVQAYTTNDWVSLEEDLAQRYNGRAGIEPRIAEWKNALGIGAASSDVFRGNATCLLLKLLAWNLLRRMVRRRAPQLLRWSVAWLQRALLLQPGRLTRSGRVVSLHVRTDSALVSLLN